MNAAPAVANEYLESIHLEGGRGEIIKSVTQYMAPGNQFYGIDKCDVEAYRAAVVTFVKAHRADADDGREWCGARAGQLDLCPVPTENLVGRNSTSETAPRFRSRATSDRDGQTRFDVAVYMFSSTPENAIMSGQCLANSCPNTGYQQDPTRATGTRTCESGHLRYAVNRRVAGSNPA